MHSHVWVICDGYIPHIPLATRTVVDRPPVCALRVSLEMRIGIGVFEGARRDGIGGIVQTNEIMEFHNRPTCLWLSGRKPRFPHF